MRSSSTRSASAKSTIDSHPRTQCRKLEYALSAGLRKMAISLASGIERFMRVGAFGL